MLSFAVQLAIANFKMVESNNEVIIAVIFSIVSLFFSLLGLGFGLLYHLLMKRKLAYLVGMIQRYWTDPLLFLNVITLIFIAEILRQQATFLCLIFRPPTVLLIMSIRAEKYQNMNLNEHDNLIDGCINS